MRRDRLVGIAVTIAGILLFLVAAVTAPGEGAQVLGVQTSSASQIPQALILAFNTLLLALLTSGFTWLLLKLGLDLTSYALPLSLTLSTFLLGLAQSWINLLPLQYDPAVQLILNVLVVVVGGVGTLFLISRQHTII